MTKEEMAKAYSDGFEDKDYREIAYNAFLCGYGARCELSLPSDLDETAEEYEHNLGYYECMNQWPSVAFKAGAEWMAGQYKTLGETEIYLEDDGGEEPYTQEWLDLATNEFAIPEGFMPGDKVEILIRKK